MAGSTPHQMFWRLVRRQHGVVSHAQLRALGYSNHAIEHRRATGRLFSLFRGVYAVGRREVGKLGMWMAAVLACGDGAALSHESAGQLLGFWPGGDQRLHVSLPRHVYRRPSGIETHRRELRPEDVATSHGIPVTSPACTLVDLAAGHGTRAVERAVNEADQAGVITVPVLYDEVIRMPARRRGVRALAQILAPGTFVLTASDLERLFVPIAKQVGLPAPQTGQYVNGFEVDFYWPRLDLVVEADGGRFHRTPAQQTRDRVRDHAHAAAGTTSVRFTHYQIAHERDYVLRTLQAIVARISR